jgi:hypothetical protein
MSSVRELVRGATAAVQANRWMNPPTLAPNCARSSPRLSTSVVQARAGAPIQTKRRPGIYALAATKASVQSVGGRAYHASDTQIAHKTTYGR